MEQLDRIFQGETFITDLGGAVKAEVDGEPRSVGRYAVFAPCTDGEHHQPVEVGRSLKALQKKYQVPDDRVCRLSGEVEA